MKLVGMVGGVTWLSTVEYYRLINEGVSHRLGGLSSAKILLYSLNFADIEPIVRARDWDKLFDVFAEASERLRDSGAAGIVMCANTPHLLADRIEASVGLPVIHIAEAAAQELRRAGIAKAALLGTKPTMEMDFFRERLKHHDIAVMTPSDADRSFIHETIFSELGRNIFRPETKARYLDIISSLAADGAQGAILGCTEIPLLVKQEDCSIPVFDTTAIHASAIVDFALS